MVYASTEQETAEWSRATGYIPVRKSARTFLRQQGFYELHPTFETTVVQMEFAREAPNLKHWGRSWKTIDDAMTAVVRDNALALEELKEAEASNYDFAGNRTTDNGPLQPGRTKDFPMQGTVHQVKGAKTGSRTHFEVFLPSKKKMKLIFPNL